MLNKNTISILSKLQNISNSIIISYPVVGLKDIDSSIMAKVDLRELEETTEFQEFGLYNKLSEFLSVISLVEDAEISQEDTLIKIKGKDSYIEYNTSCLELLEAYKVNLEFFDKLKTLTPILSFEITDDEVQKIRKASSVMKDLDLIEITLTNGNSCKISLKSDNFQTNFSIPIKDFETTEKDIKAVFLNENFKKIPLGSYKVSLYKNKAGKIVFLFSSKVIETLEIVVSER